MKNISFLYLTLFALLTVTFVSCDDDDSGSAENQITITIEEPVEGEVIADCADVHIHIDVDATIENHELEVILHPEGDTSDKIIDFDEHEHDKEIKFEQEVDLCSYPAGTCFHLEVKACDDHDCEKTTTAEVSFCLPS